VLNLVSAERYRRGCYEFKRPRSGRHTCALQRITDATGGVSLILILSDINMQGMGVILTAGQVRLREPA
jgi:hypothetical protein